MTKDGGRTWEPLRILQGGRATDLLQSVTFTDGGRTAWAVGYFGTILKTVTTGNDDVTWERQTSNTTSNLDSVVFTGDERTGWVVGSGGTILKTEDGGVTWTPRASGTSATLQSVMFADDGIWGLIVGDSGTILMTKDGGDTWSSIDSGTSELLVSVAIANDTTAWIVGWNGTFLRTRDGGNTWTQVIIDPEDTASPPRLTAVTFADDGESGWIVGWGGTIIRIENGGDDWSPRSSGTLADLTSVTFADTTNGWVAGWDGTILATQDGGETWAPQTAGRSGFLESVTFAADGTTGWAVGGDGTVLRTRDGGSTWTPRTSGTLGWLQSVTFTADGTTGWAAGWWGIILKTEDGGDTWAPSLEAPWRLSSVTLLTDDGNTVWAVGDGSMYRTENGGEDWDSRTADTWILSVTSGSAPTTVVWAVGWDGTVLKTQDRGDTWEQRPSGTTARLRSVSFAGDGATGWAVGDLGTVFKTTDAGDTWQPRASETSAHLRSVTSTSDGTTAWAAGDRATILKSNDRGDTWEPSGNGVPESLPPAKPPTLTAITFADNGTTGWAVGWGAILLTSDGGQTWRPLVPERDYRKYPAPWTWICYAIALLALWPAFRRMRAVQPPGAADKLDPDQPIETPTEDRLQRQPIADALSRVLRHVETAPPMTIAITGAWGLGKSSLMNLVKHDLERHNHVTMWFNAWHHQKERHLFAALMQAVRDQLTPRFFLDLRWIASVRFRIRLLYRRMLRRPGWALFFLFLTLLLFLFWRINEEPIDDLIESVTVLNVANASNWIPPLGAALPLLWVLARSIIPNLKRVNPGRLLSAASSPLRVKTFGDQLGFRHRFREAFADVSYALKPYRVAIFIDDLDRCGPEQVVEVLETTNFLVNAGPCYIIVGIDPEYVIGCIGHEFNDIGRFKREAHGLLLDHSEVSSDAEEGPDRRRRPDWFTFARHYVEKLVNFEVAIQEMTPTEAEGLTLTADDQHRSSVRETIRDRLDDMRVPITRTVAFVLAISAFAVLAFLAASQISHVISRLPEKKPVARDAVEVRVTSTSTPDIHTVELAPQSADSVMFAVRRAVDNDEDLAVNIDASLAMTRGDPLPSDPVPSDPGINCPDSVALDEGSQTSFTVVLNTRPIEPVEVSVIRVSGDGDLRVTAGSAMTFAPEGWNVPQSVTISAPDSTDTKDWPVILACKARSNDANYDGKVTDVEVNIVEPRFERQEDRLGSQENPPGDTDVAWWIMLVGIAVPVLLGGFGFWVYSRRREESHTRDSPEFTSALNCWKPVVLTVTGNSPREWKRFLNRVRFVSYRMQSSKRSGGEETLSEPMIVALAALQTLGSGEELPSPSIVKYSSDFWEWASREITERVRERQTQDPDVERNYRESLRSALESGRKELVAGRLTEDKITRFREMARSIIAH